MDTLQTLSALNSALSFIQTVQIVEVLTGKYMLKLDIPDERSYQVVNALHKAQHAPRGYLASIHLDSPLTVQDDNLLDQYLALQRCSEEQDEDSLSSPAPADYSYENDRAESPLEVDEVLHRNLGINLHNVQKQQELRVGRCSEDVGCANCGLCAGLSFDFNIASVAGVAGFKSVLKITWNRVPLWIYSKIQDRLKFRKIVEDGGDVVSVVTVKLSELQRWCESAYGM